MIVFSSGRTSAPSRPTVLCQSVSHKRPLSLREHQHFIDCGSECNHVSVPQLLVSLVGFVFILYCLSMPKPKCCICGTLTGRFRSSKSYEKVFGKVFGMSAVDRCGMICRACRAKCERAPTSSSPAPSLVLSTLDSRSGQVGHAKRRYVLPREQTGQLTDSETPAVSTSSVCVALVVSLYCRYVLALQVVNTLS